MNTSFKCDALETVTKKELLEICEKIGITKCKSKNKTDLIELIKDRSSLKDEVNEINEINEINEVNEDNIKFIDLFCGIGGFHQALRRLGAKCVLACDIDKDCRDVYLKNYGIKPLSDIKTINPQNLPDFDILCGGFPCQAFSNGGKKKSFEDERGLLFDEIIRIAKCKKPKFMFLENVKHILKVSNGDVIEYIKNKIKELEYNLVLFNMSPHDYGIPQQRERIYFICVRKDIYEKYNSEKIILNPKINSDNIDLNKFLEQEKNILPKYFINETILSVLDAWNEIIQQMEPGEKISPTIMINDAFVNYNEDEFKSFPKWKQEYIVKNKPLITKYRSILEPWYKKHETLLKKREIYGKLEWQCGPIKTNESIYNHLIQIRQSGIRIKKCKYFPTLVAISQIPIYGKQKRYITPRECARLQSFPDDFIFSEDDKKSYKQFGNSVNVENVYNIISSTLKHYKVIHDS